jgi:hypothetical protein
MTDKIQGTVKRWLTPQQFGFIVCDDDSEVFLHARECERSGEAILAEWAAEVRDKARERYRRGESRSFRAHRKPPNKSAAG